eukprot:c23240_g1_i1.p1 GENE.c23240_g1_i1~~c23240_g1_i1.p1  ORF type:complete len:264 (-),score=71.06 c23240_g1_i1:93-839(-)
MEVDSEPPVAAPPAPAGLENMPNQTIYIRNLNEKVKKEELKKSLHSMFNQFGTILDVVALKTVKMRGQAFIVFESIQSASQAIRQMQGFPFYDKPMVISYAKSKSDAVAKTDGTFVPRERRMDPKRKRELDEAAKKKRKEKEKKRMEEVSGEELYMQHKPQHQQALPNTPALPTNVLFIENLPEQCNEMMLSMLFNQFPGYKESRLVPGKPGIAFVEFDGEPQATVALVGLQGFKITEQHLMKISYRK